MNYCLFKLYFTTALHIGNARGVATLSSSETTIKSDTVFSALCHEALQTGGNDLLDELYNMALNDSIALSDALPFSDEKYFLPKPMLKVDGNLKKEYNSIERKAAKKLEYIEAASFENYIKSINGDEDFDIQSASNLLKNIYVIGVKACVSIKGEEKPQPYHIGSISFNDDCGLYIVVGFSDDKNLNLISKLLKNLSVSGIGGRKRTGFGKFELDDPIYLDEPYTDSLEGISKLLNIKDAKYKMAINCCLPKDEELENALDGATYSLIRRGGFVESYEFSEKPLKRKTLYAFDSGSCFVNTFKGDVFDVSEMGNHPVYRFLKPLFMGVNI
ncbi:UNVERIFIED_CONTAM: CRISPR-associated protein Csm4 [Acetivibrio alkalicellulosi]